MALTIPELLTLCTFDSERGLYIQKSGNDYIDSLSKIFDLQNQNDIPFTIEDIRIQPTLEEFKFEGKNDFVKICKLVLEPLEYNPKTKERKNEKIIPIDFISDETKKIFNHSFGVAYLMTCIVDGREHIIKIGQSRNTFKHRLSSYNCGCVWNWRTASTSNLKLKQSMVTTRIPVELYIYDCKKVEVYEWHDIISVPFASSYSLAVEDIMIKQFVEEFNSKPLINIQANATTSSQKD